MTWLTEAMIQKSLQVGNYHFFCQMAQICGALHNTVMHDQESGELTVDDMDGLNGGDNEESE